MIVSTTNEVPGRPVVEILGLAKGASIRSRHFGYGLLAFFRGYTRVDVSPAVYPWPKGIDDARAKAYSDSALPIDADQTISFHHRHAIDISAGQQVRDIFGVGILTQYRPHSLNNHIGIGKPWDLDRASGGARLRRDEWRSVR